MKGSPLEYEMITYLWVMCLAVWGGVANYIRKLKKGLSTRFSLAELIGDLVISALSGLLVFYLCETAQIHQLITAVFVAISGHMGSRVIFIMEDIFDKRIKELLRLTDD